MSKNFDISKVGVLDYRKTIFAFSHATTYLVEQGYRGVGFVTLASSQTVMEDRRAGFLKGIADAGLNPLIKEIIFSTHSEVYVEQITAFILQNKEIDALLFSSSVLGIAGLEALKKSGRQIPEDVAVISFDDHILFRMYSPR